MIKSSFQPEQSFQRLITYTVVQPENAKCNSLKILLSPVPTFVAMICICHWVIRFAQAKPEICITIGTINVATILGSTATNVFQFGPQISGFGHRFCCCGWKQKTTYTALLHKYTRYRIIFLKRLTQDLVFKIILEGQEFKILPFLGPQKFKRVWKIRKI